MSSYRNALKTLNNDDAGNDDVRDALIDVTNDLQAMRDVIVPALEARCIEVMRRARLHEARSERWNELLTLAERLQEAVRWFSS